MVADDLHKIAERHTAENIRLNGGGRPYPGPYEPSPEHVDRGALLAFVRRVAEMDPMHTAYYYGDPETECRFCDRADYDPHTPDCLWLTAQGVSP